MRFQERDAAILQAIQEYGGVLGLRHIKAMFWPNRSLRAAQKRLGLLVKENYLARPTDHQRRTNPVPEQVYWLADQGIHQAASQAGVEVDLPTNRGINQRRIFAKRLRDQGIRWLMEPRWIQLPHDLQIVDFRLAVERALAAEPGLVLDRWIHEGEFRSNPDRMKYRIRPRNQPARWEEKMVLPDSYFEIVCAQPLAQDESRGVGFLLEMDGGTHPRDRFAREKIVPGLAYVTSAQYRQRFGHHPGRWLVVTTGERRMHNLIALSWKTVGESARAFWFTSAEQLDGHNVLRDAIWWQAGTRSPEPRPLIPRGLCE